MAELVRDRRESITATALRFGQRAVAVLAVAVLFWLNWKIQFAAPPGYLFAMRSAAAEAGYCLAVAQDFGRDPVAAELADFWVGRLAQLGRGMGGPIAEGRAALQRDLASVEGERSDRLRAAMRACADRAVTYGLRLDRLS
ncbi:MAG: hypothetical protein ACK40I_07240 [Tabrizicola sp.]